jgi:hypothetical protein
MEQAGMEGDQDTEPNAGQTEPRRPLKANGKPYSERHHPGWAEDQESIWREREEAARVAREAARQAATQYLSGLPEFSDSTAARIDKVSRGLVKAISRSNPNIHTR